MCPLRSMTAPAAGAHEVAVERRAARQHGRGIAAVGEIWKRGGSFPEQLLGDLVVHVPHAVFAYWNEIHEHLVAFRERGGINAVRLIPVIWRTLVVEREEVCGLVEHGTSVQHVRNREFIFVGGGFNLSAVNADDLAVSVVQVVEVDNVL